MNKNESNESQGRPTLQYVAFSNLYPDPKFEVKRGKNWIEFGSDNLLPQYTISLLDKSADHAAILLGTVAFACGNGLVKSEGDAKALAMYQNGEPNVVSPNDLNAVQQKLFRDLTIHGAALLNVRWRKDKKGIADVHAVDVASMRIDSDGDGYWISSDWSNPRKHVPEFYPAFNTTDGGSQLLYIKAPSARPFPYGMPPYWAARQAIELQDELMTFNLNRTKNGFFASVLLSFDDIPTQEEQEKNHKQIKDFFTGSKGENVGGAMMMYGSGVKVEKFEAAVAPEDYFTMMQQADERIRAAHRVAGRGDIFGLSRDSGGVMGAKEDLEIEFQTYSQIVIRPLQNTILQVWQMISEINGVSHTWEIDPFRLFDDGSVTGAESDGTNPAPDAPSVDGATNVAATALNGAQIDSLVSIITQVTSGQLTRETALPLIRSAFPTIPTDAVQAMLDGAKKADAPQVPPTPQTDVQQ